MVFLHVCFMLRTYSNFFLGCVLFSMTNKFRCNKIIMESILTHNIGVFALFIQVVKLFCSCRPWMLIKYFLSMVIMKTIRVLEI